MSAGLDGDRSRQAAVAIAIGLAVLAPLLLSDYIRDLGAETAVIGLLALSLVVLTGFVGQISFCQYSFAAIGAFTVGALHGGHGWSFWPALPTGVAAAAGAGVLVGIPALRLRGLFLAILTVAVALFVDRFLLAPGTWDGFSGGTARWRVPAPALFGASLDNAYTFYLFALLVLVASCGVVWNLRTQKTGRLLRAIRESDLAAATSGVDVTAWKLGAFALSAGLAGLAGCLQAVAIGSVSPESFTLFHSVALVAAVTVMGVGRIASGAVAGGLVVLGPVALARTALSPQWFDLILGAALILQLVFKPEGVVTAAENRVRAWLTARRTTTRPLPSALGGG